MSHHDRHLERTTATLPSQATAESPVQADACFQWIVSDNLSGGVWYDYLDRPVYENLTHGARRVLHPPSRCVTSLTAFGHSTNVVSTADHSHPTSARPQHSRHSMRSEPCGRVATRSFQQKRGESPPLQE